MRDVGSVAEGDLDSSSSSTRSAIVSARGSRFDFASMRSTSRTGLAIDRAVPHRLAHDAREHALFEPPEDDGLAVR